MRALTWQINGRVKYLIGIMLITRWLQNSLAHTSTDHICQHSAKPQKPKEPAIKVRGVFGVRKVKTKNPHHNLARVCRALSPLRPPKTLKNALEPPENPCHHTSCCQLMLPVLVASKHYTILIVFPFRMRRKAANRQGQQQKAVTATGSFAYFRLFTSALCLD